MTLRIKKPFRGIRNRRPTKEKETRSLAGCRSANLEGHSRKPYLCLNEFLQLHREVKQAECSREDIGPAVFLVRHKPLRNLGLKESIGVEVSSQPPSKDLRPYQRRHLR